MSYAQSSCHRSVDHDTKVILNRLGYGCHVSTSASGGGGGGAMVVVGVVVGVLVVIGIVVGVVCSANGRKKRDLDSIKTNLLD